MPRFLTPIDLRLTDFARIDKRSDAGLCQAVPVFIHTSPQRRSFDAVLAAILLLVSHARLLDRFAIS
jgi:hypothetical protein